MRNRILAGVGVAALATVGIAAPANAVSDTTADVWVVHAVPGTPVDVWINGEPGPADLLDFQPGEVVPLVDLDPGEYVIDIQPEGVALPAEGDGLISLTANVAAGVSYTLVAHPEVDTFAGEEPNLDLLTISAFENDISALEAGDTRVTVRHTADAPNVDIVVNGETVLFGDVPNGAEGVADVDAATYDISVVPAGETEPVVFDAELPLAAGTAYFVHAFGTTADLDVIIFEIADLGPAPEGAPFGGAGLVAESGNGALIGGAAALLIALLAAAGIIARRATVSSK